MFGLFPIPKVFLDNGGLRDYVLGEGRREVMYTESKKDILKAMQKELSGMRTDIRDPKYLFLASFASGLKHLEKLRVRLLKLVDEEKIEKENK